MHAASWLLILRVYSVPVKVLRSGRMPARFAQIAAAVYHWPAGTVSSVSFWYMVRSTLDRRARTTTIVGEEQGPGDRPHLYISEQ